MVQVMLFAAMPAREFDDVPEAIAHFSDPAFKREVWRLLRSERRDLTVILRDSALDRRELSLFSCFMKSIFPFFGNPNGPTKRIHWGTPSPHPAYNLIAGRWIRDTRKLRTAAGRRSAARPPVERERYFRAGGYGTGWSHFHAPERLLNRFTDWRIRIRGEQGGVYFVDARDLKAGRQFDPADLPSLWFRISQRLCRRASQVSIRGGES
jgi:hypothetical protein